jgi:hypothetical protein
MLSKPQSDRDKESPPIPVETLNARIGGHVVRSLGSPNDLINVKVHPIGNDRYRVNVMVGKSAGTARVANSFFLTADGEGNIVNSSPKIVRLYGI